jgi:hypothetical protein
LRFKWNIFACVSAMILGGVLCSAGQQQTKVADSSVSSASTDPAPSSAPGASKAVHEGTVSRFEGEKRYRANCGRCHMAPHKFPPRMMATIVRHMRVRATITDEDMRLILRYMTE